MGQLPCGNLSDSGWGEVRSGSSHLFGWTIWTSTWPFAENTTGQPLCIYWPVCGLSHICAYMKPLRLKFLLVARTFPGITSRLTTVFRIVLLFWNAGPVTHVIDLVRGATAHTMGSRRSVTAVPIGRSCPSLTRNIWGRVNGKNHGSLLNEESM